MSRSCSDLCYVQLVYEYLLHMGMEGTAAQFKEDCSAGNLPIPDEPGGIKRRHISDLVQLFDEENEHLFFKVFNSVISQDVKFSLAYKKIMVDLLVYFAALSVLKQDGYDGNVSFKPLVDLPPRTPQHFETRPMHHLMQNIRSYHSRTDFETLEQFDVSCGRNCEMRHCMCKQGAHHSNALAENHALKPSTVHYSGSSHRSSPIHPGMCGLLTFLDKECSNLKDHPYFLPYFSLPFTTRPQTHPQFKHIFQDAWVGNLRKKLWDFLVLHRQAAKIPDLVLLLPVNEVPSQGHSSPHAMFNKMSTRHDPAQKKSQSSQRDGESVSKNDSASSVESLQDHCVPEALSSYFCDKEDLQNNVESVSQTIEVPLFSSPLYNEKNKVDPSFDLDRNNVTHDSPEAFFLASEISFDVCNLPCHSIPYLPPRKSQSRPPHHSPIAFMIKPAVQDASSSSSTQFLDPIQNYENLKLRYHQLHSDYHNLIGVAAELTGALENSIKGHQVDLKEILKNCIQIFPELFHQNSFHDFVEKPVDIVASNQIQDEMFIRKSPGFELDMKQVKSNLIDGNVKARLLLLQALRWRITQSSKEVREYAVREYVEGDLLHLNSNGSAILDSLLMPSNVETPHPLQQATARLINALASLKPGRDYLARSSVVVNAVCHVLKQYQNVLIDKITKDMLVASLQKLSLRRSQRVAIIELGMVEWLVQHLAKMINHRPYTLEYSSALLMNLCLHRSAKLRCIPIAKSIISVLLDLLSTPVDQALPYVNGTLYSLLTNPELNVAAAHLGLAAILENKILEQENLHLQKQMEYILLFHRNSLLSETTNIIPQSIPEGEMIDDDSEEIDLLEEELDGKDPVRSISGELCGDALLRTNYATSAPWNAFQDNSDAFESAAAITGHPVSFLLIRPSTPLHCSTTPALSEGDSEGVVVAGAHKGRSCRVEESQKASKPDQIRSRSSPSESRSLYSAPGIGERKLKLSSKSEEMPTATEDVNEDKGDQAFAKTCGELPEITVDYASTRERSSDENDSRDVEVGAPPWLDNQNPSCLEEEFNNANEASFIETSDVKIDEEKEGFDAAFVSRPKIPRTPPH